MLGEKIFEERKSIKMDVLSKKMASPAYKADWREYSQAMRRSIAWGGEPEIRAISELAQTNIHVLGIKNTHKEIV